MIYYCIKYENKQSYQIQNTIFKSKNQFNHFFIQFVLINICFFQIVVQQQSNTTIQMSNTAQNNLDTKITQTQDSQNNTNNNSSQNNQEQSDTRQIQKLAQNLTLNDSPDKQKKTQEQQHNEKEDNTKSPQKESQCSTELTQTKYFININRNNIPFGKTTLFPGSIQQVDVVIQLKDQILEDNGPNNPFMLRVIAKCNNQEFNQLDQYVFSVRSNQRFQYFEEVRFKIRKRQKAQVKVAVKIPPVKQNYVIQGFLEVQLEGLQPVCYPIVAKCQVPQIICIKDLYKPDQDTQVIKVPAKKNQIRMPPIPFKNMSNFNFTLQVEAISNQSFANKPYDVITQNFVNCQANTQFFVNIQLKQNMSYKGPLPSKDTIRKILILKIKNSSVYFNYPLQVFVFESSNAGGMS